MVKRRGRFRVLGPVRQAGVALNAGLGRGQGRDRLGAATGGRIGDVLDVAAGAALFGNVEGAPEPGRGLTAEMVGRRCAPKNAPAGGMVPDEGQIVRRAGTTGGGCGGGHGGRRLVAGMAGLARGVGDRDERLLVAGLAIVLKEGVGRGKGAAGPLLVGVDPRLEMSVEGGEWPDQAEGDDAQTQDPGNAATAEKARLGYDPAGRNTAGGLALCRLGSGEVDQDPAAVAQGEGQAMVAAGQAWGRLLFNFAAAAAEGG